MTCSFDWGRSQSTGQMVGLASVPSSNHPVIEDWIALDRSWPLVSWWRLSMTSGGEGVSIIKCWNNAGCIQQTRRTSQTARTDTKWWLDLYLLATSFSPHFWVTIIDGGTVGLFAGRLHLMGHCIHLKSIEISPWKCGWTAEMSEENRVVVH